MWTTTNAGNATPVTKTLWPDVLGALATGIGVIGAAGGLLTMMGGATMADAIGSSNSQFSTRLDTFSGVLIGVNTGLAVVLTVIGVGLLRRRPWTLRVGRYWARAKIGAVAVTHALAVMAMQGRLIEIATSEHGVDDFVSALAAGPVGVAAAVSIAVSLVLPTSMLAWFRRKSIQAEMNAWRPRAAASPFDAIDRRSA